jgi:hypothetical protein
MTEAYLKPFGRPSPSKETKDIFHISFFIFHFSLKEDSSVGALGNPEQRLNGKSDMKNEKYSDSVKLLRQTHHQENFLLTLRR